MRRTKHKGFTIVFSESEDGDVEWEIHDKKDNYVEGDGGHNDWDMAEDAAKEYIDSVEKHGVKNVKINRKTGRIEVAANRKT